MNTTGTKGKIGVLVEDHFDENEYRRFRAYFPERQYSLDFLSRLWGADQLTFHGNDLTEQVTVTTDLSSVEPSDYKGIILIGAYAMDRLRYEETPEQGQENQSPAVTFLRKAMNTPGLKIGTICHSLWLFTAAPDLLRGREVTCAHNILYDVQNAGGTVMFDGQKTKDIHVDGNLISARHPDVVDHFMQVFVDEIENDASRATS